MLIQNTLLKTSGAKVELRDGELTLGEMYSAIGCDTVERVQLSHNSELWCDENGLSKDFVVNDQATKLYRAAYPDVDPNELGIVGHAILTTRESNAVEENEDGEHPEE